jgi:hypothetical protein
MGNTGKRGGKKRQPRRIETRSNLLKDMVYPIALGVVVAVAISQDLDFAEGDAVTWLLMGLLVAVDGFLIGYVVLWIRSRLANTEIEFRDHDVWLPPGGMRVRGRTVRYSEIESVEVSGPGNGRRVKVRWHDGSLTYGWDFVAASLQSFAHELEQRAGRRLVR